MRAFVLDRAERTHKIERVSRKGNIVFRANGEYAMRGVSWTWGKPAYPRSIFALQFIPVFGPFLSAYALMRESDVLIADGISSTLEPRENNLTPSLTDEQALAVMTAHSEAMSIGRSETPIMLIVAIAALAVAGMAVIVSLVR